MLNSVKEELLFTNDYIIDKIIAPIFNAQSMKSIKKDIEKFFTISLREFVDNITIVVNKAERGKINERLACEKVSNLCNKIALKANKLSIEKIKNKDIEKEIKKAFRLCLEKLIYRRSILMKRALEKPRGYPGDYATIEKNYDNTILSKGIGKYFDSYFLTNNYAIAVRNRKDKMREILFNFINTASAKQQIRIVDLGAGSAREIRELAHNPSLKCKNVDFICVDFDEEALRFCKKELSDIPTGFKVSYFNRNLLTLFNNSDDFSKYRGTVDMVYTIGFADYFLDTVLEKLVTFSFNLLSDNGIVVIAHKDIDADPFTPIYFDWFCDWKFVQRNKERLIKIIKNSGINNYSISVEREKSGIIFFIKIHKLKKGSA